MGLVTNIVDFTPGTPIFASEVNGNFDNIVQVVNGGLDDHNVAGFTAAVIVAGEFDLDRIPVLSVDKIPQLPASRIASGVFHEDRIPAITVDKVPNLPASKVTSGAFSADRIPNLSANKITSGTMSSDRVSGVVTVASPQTVTGKKAFHDVEIIGGGTLDASKGAIIIPIRQSLD